MSSIKNGCPEGGGRCCCIGDLGEILRNPDKWTDLFTRIKDSPSGQPRFSLKGVRLHLLRFGGYRKGSFKPLDDILGLLESERIIPIIEDSGALGIEFGHTDETSTLRRGSTHCRFPCLYGRALSR
jgi:hypothetical protein